MMVAIKKSLSIHRNSIISNFIRILSILFILTHSIEAADLTLAWDANDEASLAGYYVYYSTNSPNGWVSDQGESPIPVGADQLENPHIPTFKMTGLDSGQTYFLSITAFNHDGKESDFSNMITYAPPPTTHKIFAVSNEFGMLSQEGELDAFEGSTQTFMVIANPFCHVVNVTLNGVSLGAVSTVTVENIDQDHEILAVFEENEYTLTLSSSDYGNISQEGIITVSHGSTQTFIFTAEPNCRVKDILVDGISKGPLDSLTLYDITNSHTVNALFEKEAFTITGIAGENGTIAPNGSSSFEYGSSQTFTIIPNDAYEILDVLVDGISIGAVTEYTFENITGPHAIEALFAEAAIKFDFEVNELSVNQNWKNVSYQKTYANPIVVAGSHSLNDDAPAVIRIQNITQNGFDVCLQEWDYLDDVHVYERAGYVVMEAGSHDLPDGTQVKAGTIDNVAIGAFKMIYFDTPFNVTPVVIATASTVNGSATITPRIRNISPEGFQLMLQKQQVNVFDNASETVSFIAWEPSQGNINGISFEIGATPSKVTDNNYLLSFNQFFSSAPSYISALQTYYGSDTASIRWQDKTEDDIKIKVAEEQSLDEETYHVQESVGYMLFLP